MFKTYISQNVTITGQCSKFKVFLLILLLYFFKPKVLKLDVVGFTIK